MDRKVRDAVLLEVVQELEREKKRGVRRGHGQGWESGANAMIGKVLELRFCER